MLKTLSSKYSVFVGYGSSLRGNIFYHRISGPSYFQKEVSSELDHESYHIGNVPHRLNSFYSFIDCFDSSDTILKIFNIAGKCHRITGPACEFCNVDHSHINRYYINGTEYTKAEYNRILKIKNA